MSSRARAVGALFLVSGFAAIAVMGSQGGPTPLRLVEVKRSQPRAGIELVEGRIQAGRAFRGRFVSAHVELEHADLDVVLNPAKVSLGSLADDDTWLVVNAGYFTAEFRPTGLIASGGKTLHPFVPQAGSAGSGVLIVDKQVKLLERDHVKPESFAAAQVALQAGPRVIEDDGAPGIRSSDGMRANRSVVGRDGRGRLVVAVVYAPDGGLGIGPTLFELQSVLGPDGLGKIAPELALSAALNLDGGPSTGLYLRDPPLSLPASSRVASVLRVRTR